MTEYEFRGKTCSCQPLLADCKKANGKPANVATRLDALKVIAEKLPGQVHPEK